MAYWPDVHKGQKVQRSAMLENDVRHMINPLGDIGGAGAKGAGSGIVRVQVWNASGSAIPAYSPVAFDMTQAMAGNAYPVVLVSDVSKPYGVLPQALAAREMGDCIIAGLATIRINIGTGMYATPNVNANTFNMGDTGSAALLYRASGSYIATVMLGKSSPVESGDKITGAFDVMYDEANTLVKVYNSSSPTSSYAGYVYSGVESYHIPVAAFTPADGYLYIDMNYQAGTYQIAFASSVPSVATTERRWIWRLAQVRYSSVLAPVRIEKYNLPGNVTVFDRWT